MPGVWSSKFSNLGVGVPQKKTRTLHPWFYEQHRVKCNCWNEFFWVMVTGLALTLLLGIYLLVCVCCVQWYNLYVLFCAVARMTISAVSRRPPFQSPSASMTRTHEVGPEDVDVAAVAVLVAARRLATDHLEPSRTWLTQYQTWTTSWTSRV